MVVNLSTLSVSVKGLYKLGHCKIPRKETGLKTTGHRDKTLTVNDGHDLLYCPNL